MFLSLTPLVPHDPFLLDGMLHELVKPLQIRSCAFFKSLPHRALRVWQKRQYVEGTFVEIHDPFGKEEYVALADVLVLNSNAPSQAQHCCL